MTTEQKSIQFYMLVYIAAAARDASRGTQESQFITSYARRIPHHQIPDDTYSASYDLIAMFDGRPFEDWMGIPKAGKTRKARACK